MKKSIICLAVSLLAGIASANVVDAPHNDMSCSTCHSYSLWWQYSPTNQSQPPNDHTALVYTVCMTCHDGAGTGDPPAVTPHTSTVIGSKNHYHSADGWRVGCTDCHDPHFQRQLEWGADAYLITGKIDWTKPNTNNGITLGTATIGGKVYDTTTIAIETTLTKNDANWPIVNWVKKNGNDGRGLILAQDIAHNSNTFTILSASSTAIVVKGILDANTVAPNDDPDGSGPLPANSATAHTFGLTYGQLIKKSVTVPYTTPAESREVKFVNPIGGFVDTISITLTPPQTPTGICQVCHTLTADNADPENPTPRFRNTGTPTGANDSHANFVDETTFGGNSTCTTCHAHLAGFKGSGHSASTFSWIDPCHACHSGSDIVADVHGNKCALCHVNPSAGNYARQAGVDGDATVAGTSTTASCTVCHNPIAFPIGSIHHNGTASGMHAIKHLDDLGRTCSDCHGTNRPPLMADGLSLTSTTTCAACHTNGAAGDVPNKTDYKDGWSLNYSLGCTDCHYSPPNYVQGQPKSNSHSIHQSFTCNYCHSSVTHDGITITDTSRHTNAAYNVDPDDSSGVTFTYAFSDTGGTCTNISCHGNSTATWGSPLAMTCPSCHLGVNDVDDFTGTFDNNTVISKIADSGEWDTTGHGRASGNYPSGKAAANFTVTNACLYCHDTTISHQTATNPFRLRNLNDPTWGKNGVCQSCHATGSAGVTVEAILRNGVSKIGSIHYGMKHSVTNNGGQFCWDCHDAHGDGNVFMIHTAVAKTSNATTGAPTSTVATVFTSFASGSDYAMTSLPYNGICQACHTSTRHWSPDALAAGDNHYANNRCTDCHQHSTGFAHGGDPTNSCSTSGCHDSGMHPIHMALDAATCLACHNPNSMRDSEGKILFSDGFALDETTVCSTCHKNGVGGDANVPGTLYKPGWESAVFDIGCNDCHGAPPDYANGSPKVNSHSRHNVYGYNCAKCHYSTTRDGVTIASQSLHLNGVNDVTFADATISYNAAARTCSNTFCHSNGMTVEGMTTASTSVSPSPTLPRSIMANTSAAWGSGPLPCSSCHDIRDQKQVYPNADPNLSDDIEYTVDAYPDNHPDLQFKANSHGDHLFLGCNACHYATTSNGTTITGTDKHVNGVYDLTPDPNVVSTIGYTYDAGGGSCTAVCHSSNFNQHNGALQRWGFNTLTALSGVYAGNNMQVTMDLVVGDKFGGIASPYAYFIEWGDGATDTVFGKGAYNDGPWVWHQYDTLGAKATKVWVRDSRNHLSLYPRQYEYPTLYGVCPTGDDPGVTYMNTPVVPNRTYAINGSTITITDLSVDPDYSCNRTANYFETGKYSQVKINWGDGTVAQTFYVMLTDNPNEPQAPWGKTKTFSHTYSAPFSGTISYSVKDNVKYSIPLVPMDLSGIIMP